MSLYETLPIEPQFDLEEDPQFSVREMEFQSGDVQVHPRFHKERRSFMLQWQVATEDEQEKLRGFILAHSGAETAFLWDRQSDMIVPRPYMGPRVDVKEGGVPGARGLYVAYSWGGTAGETLESYRKRGINLAAGELLMVYVKPFPENVTYATVYVGTAVDALKAQADTITDPTIAWAEPTSGYDTGGAAPPTSNTLTEALLVWAVEDTLSTAKLTANAWQLSVRVLERLAS
jgi:phage-related protein